MGEAKRLKTLDDIYGRGKLPESARPFIRAMQEMVGLQAASVATKSNARSDHQFFLDGELNGERNQQASPPKATQEAITNSSSMGSLMESAAFMA